MSFKKSVVSVVFSFSLFSIMSGAVYAAHSGGGGSSSSNATVSDVSTSQGNQGITAYGTSVELANSAKFAGYADEAGYIDNITDSYSEIAGSLNKGYSNLQKKLTANGVQGVDTAFSALPVGNVNNLAKKADELVGVAKTINESYQHMPPSTPEYDKELARLENMWADALSDIKNDVLSDNYDENLTYHRNMYNSDKASMANFVSAASAAEGTARSLLSSQGENLTDAQKSAISSAIDEYSDLVDKASGKMAEVAENYSNYFPNEENAGSPGVLPEEIADVNQKIADAVKDAADTADSGSSSSTDTSSASGSSAGGSSTGGSSAAASSSGSGSSASSERIPFCSRTAGVAGKGNGGGGSSGGNGDGTPGEAVGPSNPAACEDIANMYDRMNLKEHGLSFSVFVNAMKGFNILGSKSGKLAIIDFTHTGDNTRYYVMDLNDYSNPSLVTVAKSSHGSGNSAITKYAVGEGVVMKNTNGAGYSSIGFMESAETYSGKSSWPTSLNASGHKGRRLKGLEPGYNDNVYGRGVVMHSCCSEAAWGYAPTSLGCQMFAPSKAVDVIMNAVGQGTLIYSHNDNYASNGNYLANSPIINGNHGISSDCK